MPDYLNSLRDTIHAINRENGFYEIPDSVMRKVSASGQFSDTEALAIKSAFNAMRLALIVSKVSEELEADRKGVQFEGSMSLGALMEIENDDDFKALFEFRVKDTAQDEAADALIRILDKAGNDGTDIHNHVLAKLRYNTLRGKRHGGKRF